MKKHKPCFWRNMLQSGPYTRLPALTYTQLQFSALPQIILGNWDLPVDSVLSVKKPALQYREGEGGWEEGCFLSYWIAIKCILLQWYKVSHVKLNTVEGKHIVMTGESSKRNVWFLQGRSGETTVTPQRLKMTYELHYPSHASLSRESKQLPFIIWWPFIINTVLKCVLW